jgi:uncharacterized membrane protein YkoI
MIMRTLIAIFFVVFVASADEGDTKTDFKSLPPAVQRAAKEQSKGAKVRGYSKESEDGKTYYEVELLRARKTKDVLLDNSGKVVEIEQQVDFASLPPAVKEGLQKQAAQGKVLKVEQVSKGGAISYEAVISSGHKHREIAVDSDGNAIKPD